MRGQLPPKANPVRQSPQAEPGWLLALVCLFVVVATVGGTWL